MFAVKVSKAGKIWLHDHQIHPGKNTVGRAQKRALSRNGGAFPFAGIWHAFQKALKLPDRHWWLVQKLQMLLS
jgi:hypothetical protein